MVREGRKVTGTPDRFARHEGNRRDDTKVALLIFVVVFLAAALLEVGFSGADDYRYLLAAERWADEGPHAGANHWANRIPYVLSMVGAFAIFGTTDLALNVLHGVMVFTLAFTAWKLALLSFVKREAALFSLLAVLGAPVLMRMTTYFYPEVMEIVLLAITTLMVFQRQRWEGRRRVLLLLAAGIAGGLAMVVRQTAIAVPVSLAAVMFFMTPGDSVAQRIKDIAVLAAGFILPLLGELLFYVLVAGDPFYRFGVDTAHVKIASRLKNKDMIDTDQVLFNWELARNWKREDAWFDAPWFLQPWARLFVGPGMIFIPVIGIVGAVLAFRAGGAPRRLAVLTALIMVLQYALNTFVLVLPPNLRYFGLGLVLLSMLAGYAVYRLLPFKLALLAFVALIAAPTILILLAQPRYLQRTDDLAVLIRQSDEPVWLPAKAIEYTALLVRNDPVVRSRVRVGPAPVGSLIANFGGARAVSLTQPCPDGTDGTALAKTLPPYAPFRPLLASVGMVAPIPGHVGRVLNGEVNRVSLYRRVC